MCDEKQGLLNAYLDGELSDALRSDMDRHLAGCPSCRTWLEDLRHISDLLRAAPQPAFTSPERFAANLLLQLNAHSAVFPQPEQSRQETRPTSPSPLWWLAPAGLAAAWIIVGAMLTVSSALALADGNGLLGSAAAWLPAGSGNSLWFSATLGLLGPQLGQSGRSTLTLLDQLNRLSAGLMATFFWQALIGLCYWIWLAGWWLKGRPLPVEARKA